VLDASESGADMLLDLVSQLLYIPMFPEWVVATVEKGDQFVVAIHIAVCFTWPVVNVVHGQSQGMVSLSCDRGEKGSTIVYM
jgi:hypothetical protein